MENFLRKFNKIPQNKSTQLFNCDSPCSSTRLLIETCYETVFFLRCCRCATYTRNVSFAWGFFRPAQFLHPFFTFHFWVVVFDLSHIRLLWPSKWFVNCKHTEPLLDLRYFSQFSFILSVSHFACNNYGTKVSNMRGKYVFWVVCCIVELNWAWRKWCTQYLG